MQLQQQNMLVPISWKCLDTDKTSACSSCLKHAYYMQPDGI